MPRCGQEGLEFSFTPLELLLAAPTSIFCLWYYRRKHWFANNVLGLAFRCDVVNGFLNGFLPFYMYVGKGWPVSNHQSLPMPRHSPWVWCRKPFKHASY